MQFCAIILPIFIKKGKKVFKSYCLPMLTLLQLALIVYALLEASEEEEEE